MRRHRQTQAKASRKRRRTRPRQSGVASPYAGWFLALLTLAIFVFGLYTVGHRAGAW